ncbi:MAG: RecX family transcriptional regulator [Bacteroidia bacterium]|nr:RecX family transcriptional regulator [Bacteroidia bacterium]
MHIVKANKVEIFNSLRFRFKMDYQEAINKIERFINYQDRSEFEIKQKLKCIEAPITFHQKIIDELKENGSINDERFAKNFTQGKFRFKNWGRIKIKYALRKKFVQGDIIDKSMNVISEEDYLQKIEVVYQAKRKDFGEVLSFEDKAKISRHLQSKGFEMEFIMNQLQNAR